MSTPTTAQRYVEALERHQSPVERAKIQRYFKSGVGEYGEGDVFLGVRMGQVFALFLRRIDRINNWDLVDLGAWDVVGRYLADKPRDILDELAHSADMWERRTAILATLHFVRTGGVDDAFRIAELLLADDHDLIHKATGGVLRAVGTKDRVRLLAFLDDHAADMPRTMLRYAIEHLDDHQRIHYRAQRKQTAA